MTHPHLEGLIRLEAKMRMQAGIFRRAGGFTNSKLDEKLTEFADELQALAALPGGGVDWVEEIGPTGKPTGYLLRKDSDTARRDYDLFVSNVRSALGKHYDEEAGLICSIALLVAELHKAALPTPNPHEADRNG